MFGVFCWRQKQRLFSSVYAFFKEYSRGYVTEKRRKPAEKESFLAQRENSKHALKLLKFEQFEEGAQIRRSSKAVRSSIVEGYGRRYYKQDFIRFIIYALASNDETLDHLETLFETNSFDNKQKYEALHQEITILGMKLNKFLQALHLLHQSPR